MNSFKSLRRRISNQKPNYYGNTPEQASVLNSSSSMASNGNVSMGPSKQNSATYQIVELPALKQTNPRDRQELFIRKIDVCKEIADFSSNDPYDVNFKEIKRHTLLDLVDFIQSRSQKGFSEETMKAIIEMVSVNIFVAISPQLDDFDPEEDDPWLDPSWPHKQVVYELLLRLIVSSDLNTKIARKQNMIDQKFCINIINLFESEDPRERDYLKTILHRIYGKFMGHRRFIRETIGNTFSLFINESRRHNGIGELLEILGSIINGFALPLKQEHLNFIRNSLIPLHKPRFCSHYQQQLTYCITQYIDKEPKTGILVVTKLIEYWPWSSSQKQLSFLTELEEILELVPDEVISKVCDPLFSTIARCVSSEHFQVSERALFLWNNEPLVTVGCLNKNHAEKILPIVYPALLKNIDGKSGHWNPTVNSLSYNVIDLYKDFLTDKQFKAYTKGCVADNVALVKKRRLQRWDNIENNAACST